MSQNKDSPRVFLWLIAITHIKNDKSSGVTKKIKATTDWGKEWKTSYFNWVNPNSKYFPTNKSEVLKKKKEREVRQVRKGKERSSGRRRKMTDCGSGRKKKNPYNFLNTRAAVRICGGSLQPRRAQTSTVSKVLGWRRQKKSA